MSDVINTGKKMPAVVIMPDLGSLFQDTALRRNKKLN
jgi:hypothetical protein